MADRPPGTLGGISARVSNKDKADGIEGSRYVTLKVSRRDPSTYARDDVKFPAIVWPRDLTTKYEIFLYD
jgi:hypothetical protein